MRKLTEDEYAEYLHLLKAWIEADEALKGPATPDPEAQERVRAAYAAVQSFRAQHGLNGQEPALGRSAREAR